MSRNTRSHLMQRSIVAAFAVAGVAALTAARRAEAHPATFPPCVVEIDASPSTINVQPGADFDIAYTVTNTTGNDCHYEIDFDAATGDADVATVNSVSPSSVGGSVIGPNGSACVAVSYDAEGEINDATDLTLHASGSNLSDAYGSADVTLTSSGSTGNTCEPAR